jgi:WhiB family redox-sensing transcriptional regulator
VTAPWQARAACAHLVATGVADADDWRARDHRASAARVCDSCPVRQECLRAALAEEAGFGPKSRHGIRGGLSPSQRARLDTGPKRSGAPSECGTEGGARTHRRRGERVCTRCVAAERAASADRKARAA